MAIHRYARREHLGLTPAEFRTLARLDSPRKIQDFLSFEVRQNFEPDGDTVLSVREVLAQRRAHCIEGAMVAACALWIHGEPPLLAHMGAVNDYDHVIALYRRGRCWGAISKTNAPPLRYRDPVYRSLRELMMSYFHEYSNRRREKTLRNYSVAFDLRRMDPALWVTNEKSCWEVDDALGEIRHYDLVTLRQVKLLRTRDRVEHEVDLMRQWRRPRGLKKRR
ncbi:MAG: hypothetical protein MUF79_12550 [Burkholderiales bacterium]|nr:hypothetical protein [Burkholderiales bacterium]